jgi:hypothetical protein
LESMRTLALIAGLLVMTRLQSADLHRAGLQMEAAFPVLKVVSGQVEALSATSRVSLVWLQEGQRKRYFPDLPKDSLIARVESEQVLVPLSASAQVVVSTAMGCHLQMLEAVAPLALANVPEGQAIHMSAGARVRLRSQRWLALVRAPAGAKRGAGKAAYALDLLLDTPSRGDCGPTLELDLGRPVPARLLKTHPPRLAFKKLQNLRYCLPAGSARRVFIELSDAALIAYPPMNLKQREASQRLVQEALSQGTP